MQTQGFIPRHTRWRTDPSGPDGVREHGHGSFGQPKMCDARRVRAGDVVGDRFEIERYVAGGGMGAVFRALDRHAGGLAAVKVLHGADVQSALRFAREAQVLAELRHPGIVQYLGHGRTGDGELWMAMEWLEGEDLGARLAGGELSVAESLEV